jgi:hypothetical protein
MWQATRVLCAPAYHSLAAQHIKFVLKLTTEACWRNQRSQQGLSVKVADATAFAIALTANNPSTANAGNES